MPFLADVSKNAIVSAHPLGYGDVVRFIMP